MKRIALSFAVLALGAGSLLAQASKAPAAQRPAAAGTVIHVRMMMQGTTYKFEPANFTVHVGDIVEFANSGPGYPHNVAFESTKIPAGAAAVLNAAMHSTNLQGPMMVQPNQTFRVSFAGAPVGTYDYYCLPHKAMGMKGVITVAAARH
jgi:plastocyanin